MEATEANVFLVARSQLGVCFLKPVPHQITREQALNLAAWLVAVADDDPDGVTFPELLNRVLAT